jgi:hypothetical protein
MQEDLKAKSQEQGQGEPAEKIELDKATYEALLNRLDELDEALKAKSKEPPESAVDALVTEARSGGEDEPPEFDSMRPSELVAYIRDEMINPILVHIETIRIGNEIKELMQEEEYKDFWDHREAIYEVARKNPQLSMRDAYHLATGKAKPQKKEPALKKTESAKSPQERLLRHLPPVHGEKPTGVTESSTKEVAPKTLEEAAARAFEDLEKGGKV